MHAVGDGVTLCSQRLAGDLETPVGAYLKLSAEFGNGFLLESVQGGAVRGRYSVLGFLPDLVFRADDKNIEIIRDGTAQRSEKPFFEALRSVLAESRLELPEDLPPMAAGIFGVMGYACVRDIETIGAAKPDPLGLPKALLMRPRLMVIFDNVRDEIVVVASRSGNKQGLIEKALACLRSPAGDVENAAAALTAPKSNIARADYLRMVAQAKDLIAAGDIFQVVLSQRFETKFNLPPFTLYRALRRTNPSPYLFYFDFGDFALAGSSPEICVQLRDGKVTLRPIAGTVRRGANAAEDKANGEKLLNDPKERAEHLMLLDLGRNDVGRIAEHGSVDVEQQFTLEHYSEVIHIVSQVSGKLKKGLDCIDVLRAAFPAGTVSGAPKVRAMQIINDLEPEARGFYAGCAGYFSANGDMDTAIILRTGLVKDGTLYVQAGAGIVADSVPENEQAECEAKARALFRAAELAYGIAS